MTTRIASGKPGAVKLVQMEKNAIDLGIVVSDLEGSVAFYQGVLGFVDEDEIPFPGGGTMRRLGCGDTTIKLVHLATANYR